MGNTAVLIFVASSLADALRSIELASSIVGLGGNIYRFRDWRFSQRCWLEIKYTFLCFCCRTVVAASAIQ